MLDPGIGFAKNASTDWAVLGHLREFETLGYPVLVGASRKRFLGALLPEGTPASERDRPTAVISALAAEAGVWGVRVHDVAGTRAALDVWRRGARRDHGGTHVNGDRITLTGLRAFGHHGVFDDERANGQDFVST